MLLKKNWRQKLADSKGLPKVAEACGKFALKWGSGSMVIPAPLEVDAVMKKVPKGKLITINEIRAVLARKHKVDFACPITTGIFAWIAAHAAEEAAAAGTRRITPYWRTLKTGGQLNEKYPGGLSRLMKALRAEGHRFTRKGKRVLVRDYEQALARIGS